MSKDNEGNDVEKGDAKSAAPDNIVRVNFGRKSVVSEESSGEDVSEKGLKEGGGKVAAFAEKQAEKKALAAQTAGKSVGGVLSFGDPRVHERLRIFSEWISGSKVMLVIDATREDVRVPAQFKNNPEMRLDFSLRFGISDFVYDRESVRCSLSFGGKDFYCVIPWPAILMMYAHETRAVVFFDDEILEDSDESSDESGDSDED